MAIMGFHQRLAELWTISRKRILTEVESLELNHCLAANAKYCWEMARLENLSLMASLTHDIEFQHEICAQLDRLESGTTKQKKTEKRDPKDTDPDK